MGRLIEKRRQIFGFSLEDQVTPDVEALLEFDVWKETLASAVVQYVDIMGIEFKVKLVSLQSLFESSIFMGCNEFGEFIEKMPQAVCFKHSTVLKHIDFLNGCSFLWKQVS